MALIHTIRTGDVDYDIGAIRFASCATAGTVAVKTASVQNGGTLTLEQGVKVSVSFTHENAVSSPRLNVDGTGDKAIYYQGSPVGSGAWSNNQVVEFTYDGTNWNMVNPNPSMSWYSF